MTRTTEGRGIEEFDRIVKEALGNIPAPPGLAGRIRAALDAEDETRGRGSSAGPRRSFIHGGKAWTIMALAASLLAVLTVALVRRASQVPAAGPMTVSRVSLEGIVVCYDCAREGEPLDYQKTKCAWPGTSTAASIISTSTASQSCSRTRVCCFLIPRSAPSAPSGSSRLSPARRPARCRRG